MAKEILYSGASGNEEEASPDNLSELTAKTPRYAEPSGVDPFTQVSPEKNPWDGLKVPPEGVRYLSVKKSLRLRLRSPVRQFVNGRRYTTPGKSVEFINGALLTHDPETIWELNRALEGHTSFRRLFTRMPNQRIMESVSKIKQEVRQKEEELLQKRVAKEGIDDLNSFDKFLAAQKRIQRQTEPRTGMASISGGK